MCWRMKTRKKECIAARTGGRVWEVECRFSRRPGCLGSSAGRNVGTKGKGYESAQGRVDKGRETVHPGIGGSDGTDLTDKEGQAGVGWRNRAGYVSSLFRSLCHALYRQSAGKWPVVLVSWTCIQVDVISHRVFVSAGWRAWEPELLVLSLARRSKEKESRA